MPIQTLNITRKSARSHRHQGTHVSRPQEEQVVPRERPVPWPGSWVCDEACTFAASDAALCKHVRAEAPAEPEDAVQRHTGGWEEAYC